MRIISGYARGRKLSTPKTNNGSEIRPTSDKAREALFSILSDRIVDARVLDLFAGTGALGCESISRGCKSVVFIDNSHNSLTIIKKNTQMCLSSLPDIRHCDISIYKQNISNGRIAFREKNIKPFDVIFADPPYGKEINNKILQFLGQSNLLANHGVIITEDASNEKLPNIFGSLTLFDKRKYGSSRFWFYEKTI